MRASVFEARDTFSTCELLAVSSRTSVALNRFFLVTDQPYGKKPRVPNRIQIFFFTSNRSVGDPSFNQVMEAYWAAPPVSRYVITLLNASTAGPAYPSKGSRSDADGIGP